jgi:hypothetical protein
MKVILPLLLVILSCLSAFSQNKNGDGQYFYTIKSSIVDEKTINSEGHAIFMQRGNKQRFEMFLKEENGNDSRYIVFIDKDKKEFLKTIYRAGSEIDKLQGSFEELENLKTREDWKLTATKEKRTIVKQNCTKWEAAWNLSWPCLPKASAYLASKIAVDPRFAFMALNPVLELPALPLEFSIICEETLNFSILIDRIENDLPDAVWFDPELTAQYPFEKMTKKFAAEILLADMNAKRIDAGYEHYNTLIAELENSIKIFFANKRPDQKVELERAIQNVSNQKKELIRKLDKAIEQLNSYKRTDNPEDRIAASLVFTSGFVEQLDLGFKDLNEQIKKEAENLSVLLSIGIYESKELLPLNEFGNYSAHKNMSNAVAEKLLKAFRLMALDAELSYLLWIWKKAGNLEIIKNVFEVNCRSEKPYILLGETFEADISLSAAADRAKYNVTVKGENLKIVNGTAKYIARPSSVGEHSFEAVVSVQNPLTGRYEEVKKTFYFEVGVHTVSINAEKMNFIYMGVDNPITVIASGISSNDLDVSVSGMGDTEIYPGSRSSAYIVKPKSVTEKGAYCNIVVKNKKTGKNLGSFQLQVKKLPNPDIRLSNNKSGGTLTAAEMKLQSGLMAIWNSSDFDARCVVTGFSLQKISDGKAHTEIKAEGGKFYGEVLESVKAAKQGDIYLFKDVLSRCPGDADNREMGSLIFEVK